jgi:hypothetical protein
MRRNPRQPSHKPKAKEQELHRNRKGGCGAKIIILSSQVILGLHLAI